MKQIRRNKGKKDCRQCPATGLWWKQSKAGKWILWETIDTVSTSGEDTDGEHPAGEVFATENRPHFAFCGDPEVEQEATAPKKVYPQLEPWTIEAVHEALRLVAGDCDGARKNDGVGFSRFDAEFGRDLAGREELTNNMAAAGRKMIRKYRGQLEAAGFNLARLS